MPATASASLDAGAPPAAAARYRNMNPALAARRYALFQAGQLPGQRGGVAAQPPPPPGDLQGTEAMDAGGAPVGTASPNNPSPMGIDSIMRAQPTIAFSPSNPMRFKPMPGAPGMGDYLQGPPPELVARLRQLGIGGPPNTAGPGRDLTPAETMTSWGPPGGPGGATDIGELPSTLQTPPGGVGAPTDLRKPLRNVNGRVDSNAFADQGTSPRGRAVPFAGGAGGGQGGRLQRQLRRAAAY